MQIRVTRMTAIAISGSIAATMARAQDTQNPPVLEEITVTATKVGAVSVQSVPFTIQAIARMPLLVAICRDSMTTHSWCRGLPH